MQLLYLSPLAFICLFGCHGNAAQYPNATSGCFHEGSQQQGVILSTPISNTSLLVPTLSNLRSLNETSLIVDHSDTVSTTSGPPAFSENGDTSGKQASSTDSPDIPIIEKVDFDQWINMDMLEGDDIPSPSMPGNRPDYGPIYKPSNEKVLMEARDHANSSLPFLKSSSPSFLAPDSISDEDIYSSYDHTMDSDEDRGFGLRLVEGQLYGKCPWGENCEIEDDYYAGLSIENNAYHRIFNPEALEKYPCSGEGSSSEESYTFRNEPISMRSWALGAAAFSTLLSKDRKRKGKHKGDEEPEDTAEISKESEKRPICRQQLIDEVKGIYAGLAMVEAKSFGFETWDAYFELKYPSTQGDLDIDMVVSSHETVTAIDGTWDESVGSISRPISITDDEKLRDRTWTEVARNWYTRASGQLSSKGRLYHHLPMFAETNTSQQSSYHSKLLNVAIPTFQAVSNHIGQEVSDSESNRNQKLGSNLQQEFSNNLAYSVGSDPWEGSSRDPFPKNAHDSESQDFLSPDTSSTTPFQSHARSPPVRAHFSMAKHTCKTCSSSFTRAYELRKHTKYHSKPIACPLTGCTYRFGRQRDLIRHQKAVHKDTHRPEEWFCPFEACRYSIAPFGRRDNLLRHVRNIHSADEILQR